MNALLLVGARFLKKNAVLYGLAAMIAGCSVLWFWPLRGLMGHYYAAPDWQGTRFSQQDAQITLNMLDVYRDKFPQEDFSIQWEGWIHIDLAGTYTFCAESDDSSFIMLDNAVLVVDNGGFHALAKKCGEMALSVGLHAIDIRYAQEKGASALRVSWITPDSDAQERPLPPLALYAAPFPVRGIGFVVRHLRIILPVLWLLFLFSMLLRRNAQEWIPLRRQLKELFGCMIGTFWCCLFLALAKSVLNLHLPSAYWPIYAAPMLLIVLVAIRWQLSDFRTTSLLLCIALGLGVALFFQQQLILPLHYHNRNTFYAPASLMIAWRPRFFSYYLANLFVAHQPSSEGFSFVPIAQWGSVWFLVISLLIIFAKLRSPFVYMYIFGLYAAVSYGYMPGIVDRIYPWDMSALCLFTLSILLLDRQYFMPLVVLLPLGMGFKETAMVIAIALLFDHAWSWKRQIVTCVLTMVLCIGMKLAITMFIDHAPIFLTMTHHIQKKALVLINSDWCLTQWRTPLSPLFINGGTFIALLCFPIVNKKMVMLKCIAIAFAVGNFFFAVIWEYRVWFEMIPVTLLGIEIVMTPQERGERER